MSWMCELNSYQLPNVTNVEPSIQTLAKQHQYEHDTPPILEWGGWNAPALLVEGIAVEDAQFGDIMALVGQTVIPTISTPDSKSTLMMAYNYVVENVKWKIEGGFSQAFFKYSITLKKAKTPITLKSLNQSAWLKVGNSQDLTQGAYLADLVNIFLGQGGGTLNYDYGSFLVDNGTEITVTVVSSPSEWIGFTVDGVMQGSDTSITLTIIDPNTQIGAWWVEI